MSDTARPALRSSALASPDRLPAECSSLAGASEPGRRRIAGIVMTVSGAASNQTGAALGAMAFPVIGPVGVVAVRQFVTALILVPVVRPRLRGLTRAQWEPIVGLAVVFSVMNTSVYASVERIGLGLAVTLEFLGPLAVAVAGSRRAVDIGCAVLAGAGVVVLANPGPATDVIGIALGLVAATAWASYILLNRSAGARLPGLHGTALAAGVSTAVWLPIAVVWFTAHPPTLAALLLAAACGVLASTIPYAVDLLALRRIPAPLFGTVTSVSPVWAALAGWLLLHQALDVNEWIGIGLIVAGNVVVSARGVRTGLAGKAERVEHR
ncbi:EamA family transporter [Gordonia iterans]